MGLDENVFLARLQCEANKLACRIASLPGTHPSRGLEKAKEGPDPRFGVRRGRFSAVGGSSGGIARRAMPKKRKSVFVTVGTTQFDSLIEALDTPECADALRGNGYGSVVIQRGKGTRELVHLAPRRRRRSRAAAGENARGGAGGGAGRSDRGLEPEPLEVRVFDFAPSLADEMLAADLVVSHAGSGSVFEALGMRKPLLVVVNDALMDNHQAELAEELGKRGHLRWCESDGLADAIATFDPRGLTPYEPGDPSGIARALDDALA